MQDELPKEQAWHGGILFERACKDFGHSVKGFALYVFFVSVAVFGLFLFVIRMAQTFFHLNILEFAGRGQLDKVWCCTWNAVIYVNYIGQVLFMHVLCLRSSSPSASFSKTREPEDIRASISSAGEALQEEIERQARGNHSVTFSKMFFVQSGLWLSLLHCFYFCRDIPEKFGEEEKVSRKDQRKEKTRRGWQTRMSSQECLSLVR